MSADNTERDVDIHDLLIFEAEINCTVDQDQYLFLIFNHLSYINYCFILPYGYLVI